MTTPEPDRTHRAAAPSAALRGVRRALVVAVVASLVVAAAMGVAAMLSGEFGELQGRIVLTTLVVAAFGATALCHLAVITRAVRIVGFTGLAAGTGAAVLALVMVWWIDDLEGWGDGLVKALTLTAVPAAALAHTNLLLAFATRRHPVIRAGRAVTIAAIAAVAVMIVLPVVTDGGIPGESEWYWRLMGIAAIADALGTVTLPVLALVLRPAPGETTGGGAATVRLVLDLPPGLAERLDAHCLHQGTDAPTREDAAREVLDRALG